MSFQTTLEEDGKVNKHIWREVPSQPVPQINQNSPELDFTQISCIKKLCKYHQPPQKKPSHIHPCVSNLPLFHPAFRLLRPFGHFQDGHGHLPAASLATGVDQRPKGDAVGRQLELHLLPQLKRMAPGSLTGTSQRRFFSSDTRNIPPDTTSISGWAPKKRVSVTLGCGFPARIIYPLGALKGHQFHWLPWHGWQHLRSPCQNAASSAAGLTAEPRHLASRNRPGWHASGRPFPYPYGPKKEKYAPHLCIGLYQLKPALGSAGQQKKILKGLSKDGNNRPLLNGGLRKDSLKENDTEKWAGESAFSGSIGCLANR